MRNKWFIVVIAILCCVAALVPIVINLIPEKTDKTVDTTETDKANSDTSEDAITSLSDERRFLIEDGVLSLAYRMSRGVPQSDENGMYLTDETWNLIYPEPNDDYYKQVETDLFALVNHYADKGYSEDAIRQIQRFHFYFGMSYDVNDSDYLKKLSACIPEYGITEDFSNLVGEQFGVNADNVFYIVQSSTVGASPVFVLFSEVKPKAVSLNETVTKLCISKELEDGSDWLEAIVAALSEKGVGEKEIIEAQLFYVGSLAQSEYTANWQEKLIACFAESEETEKDRLIRTASEQFGVSIEGNCLLMDYLDGKTVFDGGNE